MIKMRVEECLIPFASLRLSRRLLSVTSTLSATHIANTTASLPLPPSGTLEYIKIVRRDNINKS